VHLARTRAPFSGRHAAGHPRLRRRLAHLWAELPWLTRLGLVVLLAGAVGDLTFHALPQTDALQALLGVDGYRAHLVTFVGMLVMLVGVFRLGLSQAQSRSSATQGVSSRAHR
jgi:alkylation response protein AidB-like acyl-CoA dehydrogenase